MEVIEKKNNDNLEQRISVYNSGNKIFLNEINGQKKESRPSVKSSNQSHHALVTLM